MYCYNSQTVLCLFFSHTPSCWVDGNKLIVIVIVIAIATSTSLSFPPSRLDICVLSYVKLMCRSRPQQAFVPLILHFLAVGINFVQCVFFIFFSHFFKNSITSQPSLSLCRFPRCLMFYQTILLAKAYVE